MNKFFTKIAGLALGLAMGLGVAVGVAAGNKASEVKADSTLTFSTTSSEFSKSTNTSHTYEQKYTLTFSELSLVSASTVQMKKSTTLIHSGTAIPGNITNLRFTDCSTSSTSGFSVTAYGSTDGSSWVQTSSCSSIPSSKTVDLPFSGSYRYFKLQNGSQRTFVFSSIVISYSSGFNVTYEPNLPTGKTESDLSNWPTSVTGRSSYTIPSTKPSLPGYIFDGYAISQSAAASKQPGDSITETTTLWGKWTAKTSVQLSADDLDLDLQNDADGVAPLNPSHSGVTYVVDDESVATYSGGKFYPQAVGETLVTMKKDEDDNNVYVDGMFVITVTTSLHEYTVTLSGTNCSIDGPEVIYEDGTAEYEISAADGYKLPESGSISVDGASFEYNKTEYDSATLTLSDPTADVTITIEGIELVSYSIQYYGSNYTHSDVGTIKEFGTGIITLTPATHYDLPASVNVTNASFNYSKASNKLTISNPQGNVSITVNPVAHERYDIEVTGDGEYADKFTYSGDTEIYQYENAEVTLTPDTSTSDVYVIDANHIAVDGATKSYNQNTGLLTLTNPTGKVTVTVTPVKKVLQSIAVTTQPTTKNYSSGATISTNGLVVKATYTTGIETIPTNQLTFSTLTAAVVGSTVTVQTIYVYYGGKSTSFNVNVTPVQVGSSWNLVSSVSDLAAGDKVIIAAKEYNYAISTTQNSNNRGQASITKSGSTATLGTGVQELTLGKNGSNYTLYTGSGYLYAASSSSNNMKTQSNVDLNASWSITISSGTASIIAQGSNTRNVMQYNQSSSLFSCYASASQKALCIYKKVEATSTDIAISSSFSGTGSDYADGDIITYDLFPTQLIKNDGSGSDVTPTGVSPSTFVEGTNVYTVSYNSFTYNVQIEGVRPAKRIVSIELDPAEPHPTFTINQPFNHDGISVYSVYDDESTEDVTEECDFTPPDMTTEGDKQVTVTYSPSGYEQPFTTSYTITVTTKPSMNVVQGAVIDGIVGEHYDLEIELLNYTGTTSWSLNPSSSSDYSLTNVSSSDNGYSATVTLNSVCDTTLEISESNSGADPVEISIKAIADYLTGIEATTTKERYIDGDSFDKTTVTVMASYACKDREDEEVDIDDCTLSAKNSKGEIVDLLNPLPIETYTITVSYEGEDSSFGISVTMPEGLKLCIAVPGQTEWVKVEKDEPIVSGGTYQFVYEVDGKARFFNNSDAASDYVAYDIPLSGNIKNIPEDAPTLTIATMTGGYSIKCNNGNFNGQYIYGKSGSNTIDSGSTAVAVSITYETDGTVKALSNSTSFRFNSASGTSNDRFRFYKTTTTGDDYHYPYLYKKVQGQPTYEEQDMLLGVYEFLKAGNSFSCDSSGATFDETGWTALRGKYQSLATTDKAQIDNAVPSGGGYASDEMYTNFIEKYDYIVWKYGSDYDFMKRGVSSGSRFYHLTNLSDSGIPNIIISVIGLISLTSVGAYFYIRRRKEN